MYLRRAHPGPSSGNQPPGDLQVPAGVPEGGEHGAGAAAVDDEPGTARVAATTRPVQDLHAGGAEIPHPPHVDDEIAQARAGRLTA
jgi:hypothetical protein